MNLVIDEKELKSIKVEGENIDITFNGHVNMNDESAIRIFEKLKTNIQGN
jgi:hypothetical protein